EGASVATGEEGGGAVPATGDVTWTKRFNPGSPWTNPCGDFSATVSASTAVTDVGHYTWGSTSQMVADAQAWLDVPSTNFGWVLIGTESTAMTAKRFDSRENATADNRPKLTITYTPPGDCNHNGLPDDTDIASGTSKDCNANGVPDECEPDSDHDGIINACDNCPSVVNADQLDSDGNGVGDACEDPGGNGGPAPTAQACGTCGSMATSTISLTCAGIGLLRGRRSVRRGLS
ncbi:MAG TPA: thrombospondin type 3 repeat-containing protein, partial [Phycisphaerae bacterium]|nr:thrombospondin type 3 repeat-containing protein [Phycisphaerae bacterium]